MSERRPHRLIRASAGTGKTHALVEHYAQLIHQDKLAPSQTVAITFTRKAAAELRQRIRSSLRHHGADSKTLRSLGQAPITNFHGLCLNHLKEEEGLKLFGAEEERVLGEADEDRRLFSELAESTWLGSQAAVASDVTRFAPFLLPGAPLADMVWEAISRSREDGVVPCEGLLGSYDAQGLQSDVHRKALELRERLIASAPFLTTDKAKQQLDAFTRLTPPEFIITGSQQAWFDAWHAMFQTINRVTQLKKYYTVEDKDFVDHMLPAVLAEAQCAALVAPLERMILAAYAAYQAHKQKERQRDFVDIIETVQKRLGQNFEAHLAVRRRIKAVLVDEAQDTNGLQRQLVRLLVGLDGPARAGTPGAPPLAHLAVVGDWKQSIYAFRGADVANFGRFADEVAQQGGSQSTLTDSYRATPSLVTAINHLGDHLFGNTYDRLTSPLSAIHNFSQPSDVLPAMRWLAVSDVQEGGAHAMHQALGAARYVKYLSDRGVPYGEVALLMASPAQWAPLYVRAFAEYDIPIVTRGTGSLLAQSEVRDVLALMRWLGEPSSELDAAVALRSPLFALSDTILWHLLDPRGATISL